MPVPDLTHNPAQDLPLPGMPEYRNPVKVDGSQSAADASLPVAPPEGYQPPPEPAIPAVTAPPPSQIGDRPSAVRPVFGGGALGAAGSIAYIGDAILKGYMRGRQTREARQAYQLDRLQKGLRFAYDNAARNYVGLIESGADPNSKEVQDAKSARDAAWQSLMQMQGNYIMQGVEGGKSKKSKQKAVAEDQGSIQQMIASSDPKTKIQGYYLLALKAGPPDEYQARQILAQRNQQQMDPKRKLDTLIAQQADMVAKGDAAGADKLQPEIDRLRENLSPYRENLVPPKTSQVMTKDGRVVSANKQYDQEQRRFRFYDVATGQEITDQVSREVGLAQQPSMKVVKGGIQLANGTVLSVDPKSMKLVAPAGSNLPIDVLSQAQSMWDTNLMTTLRSATTDTTTDANGNVFSRRTMSLAPPPSHGVAPTLPSKPAPTQPGKPAVAPAPGPATATPPPKTAPTTKFDVERLDKGYQQIDKEIEAVAKPVDMLMTRFANLRDAVEARTPQADAMIAPELLSVSVTGGASGSGLRMNEAEIARIVGGRSHWESLKAAANKWRLDPSKALSITDEQRQEIRDLMQKFWERATLKQKVLTSSRQAVTDASTPDQQRQIWASTRMQLAAIDQGKVLNRDELSAAAKDHFKGDYAAARRAAVLKGYYVDDGE